MRRAERHQLSTLVGAVTVYMECFPSEPKVDSNGTLRASSRSLSPSHRADETCEYHAEA